MVALARPKTAADIEISAGHLDSHPAPRLFVPTTETTLRDGIGDASRIGVDPQFWYHLVLCQEQRE
jgi:hypothetical protein